MNPEIVEQDALQAEAHEVVEALSLQTLLARAGDPTLVGSAALGLMVWRDIDFDVVCPALDARVVVEIGGRLALHPDVRSVTFRNDTGGWNLQPDKYGDGLYLGVRYQVVDGEPWALDIWFVDDPKSQPSLAHVHSLAPRITDETRSAILQIKRAARTSGEYGKSLGSWDVYTAVLDDGVRDFTGFTAWLAEHAARRSKLTDS